MAKRVTQTLTISFSESSSTDSGSQIKIEVDSREDGLNAGLTSFRPGDTPGYLVFMPAGMALVAHDVSAGVIKSEAAGYIDVDDLVTFGDERELTLNYPIGSNFSSEWHGKTGGAVAQMDDYRLSIAEALKKARVLRVRYRSNYLGFRVTNIPSGIERVDVRVEGEI